MNKSRRDFIKKLPLAMSIPFTLGGIPLRVLGQDETLTKLAMASKMAGNDDRVLVILQMHGGNDGLNCLIPVENYEGYYSRRANIAIPSKNNTRGFIPLDSTLPSEAQIGLHPDMAAMKAMYDQGRVSIVQGVSYKNNNGSHFRGRDIWFMGGSADDYFQSGWLGRFLNEEYKPLGTYPEDFPNDEMKDPLAIEMGSDVSLIFHQQGNIPTSLSIPDPATFGKFIDDLEGFKDLLVDPRGVPPDYLEGSPYYKELQWILSLEDKTKDYAQRLSELFEKGAKINPTFTYPEKYPFNAPKGSLRNPLAYQLDIIAKLLSGGCQTRVFLVKIGGFDTHADQVESYNTTMGAHAALMYHISTGMEAFQRDLRARGLEDRVLTVTTSEFGRRIASNASYGTDHGTGAPLFVFGKGANPGVVGVVPDLAKGNIDMQYDYREVYASIMRNWMQVTDDTVLEKIFPGIISEGIHKGVEGVPFETLPIAQQTITGSEGFISDRFALEDCYPNPAKSKATFRFRVNSSNHVVLNLFNNEGKQMKAIANGVYSPGEHAIDVDVTDMATGNYIYELKSGFYKETKKLVILK